MISEASGCQTLIPGEKARVREIVRETERYGESEREREGEIGRERERVSVCEGQSKTEIVGER